VGIDRGCEFSSSFLVGQIGYKPTFDVIAAMIAVVACAFAARVRVARVG
jgi:hypothetical protein